MSRKRVLSGMRPTGRLHMGHLFGALDNWRNLQEEYDCFFFIADWHALTTDYADPSQIKTFTIEVVLDWLAAGLDPRKATFFVQSRLPEHAELHLLFSMFTPLAWLERVPTYKEQREQITDKDLGTYGFLGYPLLQAADILIYKAHYVPVGVDQVPHIELTREVARRFNFLYRPVLVEPEPLLTEFPKIPGTDGRKMSKSYDNAIFLSDTPEEITAKIKPMITDPARKRRTDPGNPEVCPVYDLHKVFTPKAERDSYIVPGCTTAGIGCLDCKQALLKHALPMLAPISERRAELARDPDTVLEILEDGTARAKKVASETLAEVKAAMQI
ncbi:MAG: tryptophan--tRNA ligase [candidate division NC10 bacterium RIFCSPLOWO2_12_FULL_66_18]|nr:MAG: tryptophan--tRNA ligase [candidate division NC10 bacterium RIFCSPLOWO2_02_FULL_66_22]OGB95916.1 MAG: tryptophan--tRNA ligase [candidate division NC10 bacterium RIFCSPLOWO2_12_FULL_66_18]HLG43384.1 tryptophan--tRNA ligase [Nitrospirales bacterium]